MLCDRADVAQLVEQLIRNEQVVGSIPIISSIDNSRLPRFSEVLFFCQKVHNRCITLVFLF